MLFSIVDFNNEDISYLFKNKTNNFSFIENNNCKTINFEREVKDKNNANIYKEDNVCFICYEENVPSIKFKNIICYEKDCDCNVYIHKNCLDEWYNIHSTCPICIKFMYKKIDNYSNINKNMFPFVKQNISILINVLLLLYSINCIYNFYLLFYM